MLPQLPRTSCPTRSSAASSATPLGPLRAGGAAAGPARARGRARRQHGVGTRGRQAAGAAAPGRGRATATAMRVRDWRAHGGLDVLVHAVAHRRRRSTRARARGVRGAPAAAGGGRARWPPRGAREQADAAGAAGGRARGGARRRRGPGRSTSRSWPRVIEAADNLAFSLIANSIRDVYLEPSSFPRDRHRPRGAGSTTQAVAAIAPTRPTAGAPRRAGASPGAANGWGRSHERPSRTPRREPPSPPPAPTRPRRRTAAPPAAATAAAAALDAFLAAAPPRKRRALRFALLALERGADGAASGRATGGAAAC